MMLGIDTLLDCNNTSTNGASDDAFSEFSDDMTVSSVTSDTCSVSRPSLQVLGQNESTDNVKPHEHTIEDEKINLAVVSARREFHSRRFIKVKNVPPDATEQDIRHLLKSLVVKDVQLNKVSETAKVTLVTPECLESFPSETRHELNERYVVVAPSNTEGMLCVAHLPLDYEDHEFRNLVQTFGSIARCFLMRYEDTGKSKGYGFVEYSSKDVAYHAKSRLDGKAIGDCLLHCNWLDSSHVTYKSLHSKCIYVDHLPPEYRNLIEFREVFSTIANPSYCQIAIKNGQPLGFGIVEFDSPQDASEVQVAMNRFQLENHNIRVTFCIPGYRAMVIYNKLTSNRLINNTLKQPLLPNPTSPYGKPKDAFGQLRNWSAQNPQIFQALQALMKHNSLERENCFGISTWNDCTLTSSNHQKSQQEPLSQTQGDLNGCTSNAPMPDSNISAALILLLASQLQSEMGIEEVQKQSILQDLQNAISLLVSSVSNGHKASTLNNSSNPSFKESTNVSFKSNGSTIGDKSNPYQVYKMPLLPNPPSSCKTNSGLLPRPNCPPLSNGLNSYHQHQPPAGALSHGYASSLAYQSPPMKQPLLGQKLSPSIIKTPLLGNRPGFVPNCSASQNGQPRSITQTTPNTYPNPRDVNFLQQLLLLTQSQQRHEQQSLQQQAPQATPTFGNGPQNQAILSHLRMQEAGGTRMHRESGFLNLLQMASPNRPRPSVNCTQKQDLLLGHCDPAILIGNSQFGPICAMPQAIPLSLASATAAGMKLPFITNVGNTCGSVSNQNQKLNIENGFLGPSLTSLDFGIPLQQRQPSHPFVVSQLVAGVQQRGSVLGDFWQFSQGAVFNNAQVLGVKRKLQVILPDNKMSGIGAQNASQQGPYLKRRRP